MNDSNVNSSSPYLVYNDLPEDSGDPPDINDLLPRDEGPRVLLNHGDVESSGNAVSLGTALRSALDGPTRSFTALVGFLGGQYGDDDVPADDPTEILREELEEGLVIRVGDPQDPRLREGKYRNLLLETHVEKKAEELKSPPRLWKKSKS